MAKNFAREANILDPLETAYSMIAELTGTSVTDARMQLEEYALRQNPQVQQMQEAEREQYIAKEKADLADYFRKTQPVPAEGHAEVQTEVADAAALPKAEGSSEGSMHREAIGSSGIVGPEMYSDKSILALENEAADPRWIQDPKGRDVLLAQIRDAREAQNRMKQDQARAQNTQAPQAPAQSQSLVGPAVLPSVAPGVGIMSVGALSMFNSPENLKRIADLLSKAESGLPIEAVMEEIRVATGLSGAEFWKALGDLNKVAGENPFADKGDDEKGDDKADDNDDKKDAPAKGKKGVNPFEKKDDKEEDEDESEDEGEGAEDKKEPKEKSEKKEPKSEPKEKDEKEEPEEEKKSKSEIKREKKKEKDEAKLLKEMLSLGEKLLKLEKGEDEAHVAELKNAIEILKEFSKEEKEEPMGLGLDAPSDDVAIIEKTGPDLPPAMEGLALPLPEPEMGMEGPGGMKVIDLAPPALELAAAQTAKAEQNSFERHNGSDVCPNCGPDCDCPCHGGAPKQAAAKNNGIGFKKHDRVWRKADAEGGFETVGDEPGRIIEFGEGKAIVDWGHEDGIPTEENFNELILAAAAGAEGMFSLPKQSAWVEVEPMNPAHGAMGGEAAVEMVLRETSLHDILARNAKEDHVEEGTIKHLASGKNGKILQRLAGGQLRVSVDGKELVLWPYEVE